VSRSVEQEPCPHCGEMISTRARRCRYCGRWLDDDEDERPRRRASRRETVEAVDFLVPHNVSGWSLASCYLGLIGFCLPLIGVPFGLVAVICGIVALRRQKERAVSYGEVTSNVRAIIGLILGGLAVIGWSGLFFFMWLNHAFR
jgi:hypothetical protein